MKILVMPLNIPNQMAFCLMWSKNNVEDAKLLIFLSSVVHFMGK